MQKRVFIIHRWEGYPEEGWFPWLKKELESRGFDVQVPAMPDTDEPKIDVWVPHLKKLVGKPDENTYFVGHSIGCQTILRYLETLGKDEKVGAAIFVAGFFTLAKLETDEEKTIIKPWLETPIDFEKMRNAAKNFVAIFSDNDPFVVPENQNIFKEKLGAKIIIENNKGHFSGGDGVKELPIALESLLESVKK